MKLFIACIWMALILVASGCGSKGSPENLSAVKGLIADSDSLLLEAEKLPDNAKVEKMARKLTIQYRFFYENYSELEPDSVLVELLSGLEVSRKYINRFSDEGINYVSQLEFTKTQLHNLNRDYRKGLLTDSLFQLYLAEERDHLEQSKKIGGKRIFPVIYYVNLMDSIGPYLDSAVHYYESKMRL
jgi:hypothetical protein